jgi:hypothetical protein
MPVLVRPTTHLHGLNIKQGIGMVEVQAILDCFVTFWVWLSGSAQDTHVVFVWQPVSPYCLQAHRRSGQEHHRSCNIDRQLDMTLPRETGRYKMENLFIAVPDRRLLTDPPGIRCYGSTQGSYRNKLSLLAKSDSTNKLTRRHCVAW